MSDTTIQECQMCGFEEDCIDYICQTCLLELNDMAEKREADKIEE